MGHVIAFSNFNHYLGGLDFSEGAFARGCTLDTNVLISLTYEARDNSEEMADFLDTLVSENFRCFTTVTTRAEFLDFHRRLIMTEHLLDAISSASKVKIPTRVRAQIQVQQGQLRRYEQQGRDAVFYDSNIKRIKTAMVEDESGGLAAWGALCDVFLSGKLTKINDELEELQIAYVSPNDAEQKELFTKGMGWTDAQRISEETCLGIGDALILNTLQCSRFPFAVSADTDFGLAVMLSSSMKDVLMPDSIADRINRRKSL